MLRTQWLFLVVRRSSYFATMLKLLKQILNDEDQDLKRYALILLLLASGALATTYLSHHLRPGIGLPHFTVHAAP